MRIYRDLRDNAQPLLFIAAYIVFMNSFLHVSVCPFRGITGLPCPACGMTRAGLLFLRGDFQGAFRYIRSFLEYCCWQGLRFCSDTFWEERFDGCSIR